MSPLLLVFIVVYTVSKGGWHMYQSTNEGTTMDPSIMKNTHQLITV